MQGSPAPSIASSSGASPLPPRGFARRTLLAHAASPHRGSVFAAPGPCIDDTGAARTAGDPEVTRSVVAATDALSLVEASRAPDPDGVEGDSAMSPSRKGMQTPTKNTRKGRQRSSKKDAAPGSRTAQSRASAETEAGENSRTQATATTAASTPLRSTSSMAPPVVGSPGGSGLSSGQDAKSDSSARREHSSDGVPARSIVKENTAGAGAAPAHEGYDSALESGDYHRCQSGLTRAWLRCASKALDRVPNQVHTRPCLQKLRPLKPVQSMR